MYEQYPRQRNRSLTIFWWSFVALCSIIAWGFVAFILVMYSTAGGVAS